MTKREVIQRLAEETSLSQIEVKKILEGLFQLIKKKLNQGKTVDFRKFGCFMLKKRAQKTARDIRRNSVIIVEAKEVPFFKPSKSFLQTKDASEKEGPNLRLRRG